jgi:replication factor A1
MEVKDIQANQGNIDLVLEVSSKEEPRSFEKFGKSGKVCNAKVKDDTGEVKLTLWNEDIETVNVGDKIHLQNGWCSEYQGEKQLSAGKFGKIEVVEKSEGGSQEVFTNDTNILSPQESEEPEQMVDEEELVE